MVASKIFSCYSIMAHREMANDVRTGQWESCLSLLGTFTLHTYAAIRHAKQLRQKPLPFTEIVVFHRESVVEFQGTRVSSYYRVTPFVR